MEWTTNSFWSRLTDMASPRDCAACGLRLAPGEQHLCTSCLRHLPRTYYWQQADDNPMARLLWGLLPVERAAALFFYEPGAASARLIYQLKYEGRSDAGVFLGSTMAREMASSGFFRDVDLLVPMPLARRRQRQRGYNQSRMIALGVSLETGIAVAEAVVIRTKFLGSQTQLNARQRRENVEDAFQLVAPETVRNRHIMLVDDVLTTGQTAYNCGKVVAAVPGVRISILTAGFTKG